MAIKKWIDYKKIKNVRDIDGDKCYTHLIEGNRSIGKTFNLLKYFIEQYTNRKDQFIIFSRTISELQNKHLIFLDVCNKYFPNFTPTKTEVVVDDLIYAIQFKDENDNIQTAGYSVTLSKVDNVKKYSSIFYNVQYTFLDEFQSENGKYCKKEFDKYQSLIYSIARGGGEVVRNITNFLCSNTVDLYNPYYLGFGLIDLISTRTANIVKAKGVVVHFYDNEEVQKEMEENKMLKAFINTNYSNYAVKNNAYFNRSTFLLKLSYISKNRCNYVCTIRKNNINFSVWIDPRNSRMIFSDISVLPKRQYIFTCDNEISYISVQSDLFKGTKKLIKKYKTENNLYYTTVNVLQVVEEILK